MEVEMETIGKDTGGTVDVVETEVQMEGETEMAGGEGELRRTLTLFDGVAVVVGIMVGTGIFASPGVVLKDVGGSVGGALIVWVLAGALALVGGLCFAELGAAIPASGGDYVYLMELHPSVSFLFMWACFFSIKAGSQAIIAIVFARYISSAFLDVDTSDPDLDGTWTIKLLAAGAIAVLTAVNILGVRWASLLQRVCMVFKFLAIAMVVLEAVLALAFDMGGARQIFVDNFSSPFAQETFLFVSVLLCALGNRCFDWLRGAPLPNPNSVSALGWAVWPALKEEVGIECFDWDSPFDSVISLASAIGLATVAALWAYDGFSNLNCVAEEMKKPERNLPLSIISAVVAVILGYLAANVGFLCMLSVPQAIESKTIAVETSVMVFGSIGKVVISFLVAVSAFGSLNGSILTGGRIFYAAALDKMTPFPSYVGSICRFGTPAVSLVAQTGMALALLLPGNFEDLVTYFGFTAWIFYALVGVTLIMMRWTKRDMPRPFKAPVPSLLSAGFLFAGLPLYFLFFWRGNLPMLFLARVAPDVARVLCFGHLVDDVQGGDVEGDIRVGEEEEGEAKREIELDDELLSAPLEEDVDVTL